MNPRCKRCGCTEHTPCAGGCQWVIDSLCTACLTEEETAIFVAGARTQLARQEDDRRDHFIAAALPGLVAKYSDHDQVARHAIEIAEAVIRQTTPADLVQP